MTGTDGALARLRELIDDEYTLELGEAGEGHFVLTVVPGPGACGDCLVPDDVLASIMSQELAAAGHEVTSVRVEHR